MLSDRLPHKTEAGAVSLGVSSPADVEAAIARIRAGVHRYDVGAASYRILSERMVETPLAELLVRSCAPPLQTPRLCKLARNTIAR